MANRAHSIGATGSDLCPAVPMLGYMLQRGNSPGLLFQLAGVCPLTREYFVAHMRSALTDAGIDSSLHSGHSFQVGAATCTAAALCGVQDPLMRTLGQWESSAYTIYVHVYPNPSLYVDLGVQDNSGIM